MDDGCELTSCDALLGIVYDDARAIPRGTQRLGLSESKCTQRRLSIGNTVEVVRIQNWIIEADVGAILDRDCRRIGIAFAKLTSERSGRERKKGAIVAMW